MGNLPRQAASKTARRDIKSSANRRPKFIQRAVSGTNANTANSVALLS